VWNYDKRSVDPMEVAALAGGDREVEAPAEGLLPGDHDGAEPGQPLGDAVRERAGSGHGEDDLHARVGVEGVKDVGEPRQGGQVVDDRQHDAGGCHREPFARVRPDRQPEV
jgi:hypothetical protein